MTKVSENKIANYLSDEKGYPYKVAIDVAKDIADYINDKMEEAQKETAKKIIKHLREKGHFTFDYPDDPVQNVHFGESIFEELEDMFGIEEA